MAKKVADADPDIEVGGAQFVEEFCTKPSYDEDGVQATAGIGLDGKEYGDPLPLAPPVGFSNPPDLMELMRTMIRSEAVQRRLEEEGFDTFEEAGDFDVDDDPMPPVTVHEALLMQPPAAAPPSPGPVPQVTGPTEGGGGAGSPNTPAPDAPSDPASPSPPPVRPT